MERLKNITIIFLLVFGLLTSASPATTVSVLLQEGLYAEEIKGDLDAAIKIYKQVISESKETQRAAAQATYRIGMCFLKKGEKAKAAEQFQNLLSKYPEEQTLGTRAREQLEKLGPAFMGSIDSAESVPVNELIKSGKVPCFKVQLSDNTALDLDSGEIIKLIDEGKKIVVAWPDKFEVVWDNDEGGGLMIKTGSNVRVLTLPSGATDRWENAISLARSKIDMLRRSNASVIWPSRNKFAAVLTSKGNLAVIQIGEYDAKQGTIYGWVEKIPAVGFGPEVELTVNDISAESDMLIDFESGKLFTIPKELKIADDFDHLFGAEDRTKVRAFFSWIQENGIDALADLKASLPRLIGFDMAAIPRPRAWSRSPDDLIDKMHGRAKEEIAFISAKHSLTTGWYIKTREAGMGVLQVVEAQTTGTSPHVKIRYKMLQKVPAAIKAKGQELKQRAESARRLKQLWLAVACYAADHDSKLPDTLQELELYVGKKQGFQWILENVEYLGKGKTLAGSPGEIVAYDKTMLENGKGTNILYKDAHVQFLRPEGLRKEPGIEGLEKAQIHRRSDERYEPK